MMKVMHDDVRIEKRPKHIVHLELWKAKLKCHTITMYSIWYSPPSPSLLQTNKLLFSSLNNASVSAFHFLSFSLYTLVCVYVCLCVFVCVIFTYANDVCLSSNPIFKLPYEMEAILVTFSPRPCPTLVLPHPSLPLTPPPLRYSPRKT